MGISVTKLLIVLAIIVVLFGTKRFRNIGSDLGGAIKNFRLAMKDGENEKNEEKENDSSEDDETSEQTLKK